MNHIRPSRLSFGLGLGITLIVLSAILMSASIIGVATSSAEAIPTKSQAKKVARPAFQQLAGLRRWRINRVGPRRIQGEPGGLGDLAGAPYRTVFGVIFSTCGSPSKQCILPVQVDVTVIGPGGLLGVTRKQTYPNHQRPCTPADRCP